MAEFDRVRIGIVSVSDRASSGVYEDKGLPALKQWLGQALLNPIEWAERLIPDEQALISQTLIDLVDAGCCAYQTLDVCDLLLAHRFVVDSYCDTQLRYSPWCSLYLLDDFVVQVCALARVLLIVRGRVVRNC